MNERFLHIAVALHAARETPHPAQGERLIQEACAGDEALLLQLRAILAAHTFEQCWGEVVRSNPRRGRDLVAALVRELAALDDLNPQMAHCVSLRIFGGRTNDEAARELSISSRRAKRMWACACAWLNHRLWA